MTVDAAIQEATDQLNQCVALLGAVEKAYIKESIHPDCLDDHRFRVTMPDGTMQYRASRQEAQDLFRSTAALIYQLDYLEPYFAKK